MANISDFKAHMLGGGARPNQFRVDLAFPSFVNLGNVATIQSQFLCNATVLPSSDIEKITVAYRGRQVNFAGEKSFRDWTVSIYTDTNFNIRNAFEQWSNGIQNNSSTNGIVNPLSYQVDMSVNQLDRNGSTVKTYRFKDAFPIEVGEIQLGYDQNNSIETFSVTFAYNYWTSNTSTEGSSFSVSGTANTPIGSFPL